MRTIKQVNIKNRQNYFFNDMTKIKDCDPSLLNIDQLLFETCCIQHCIYEKFR